MKNGTAGEMAVYAIALRRGLLLVAHVNYCLRFQSWRESAALSFTLIHLKTRRNARSWSTRQASAISPTSIHWESRGHTWYSRIVFIWIEMRWTLWRALEVTLRTVLLLISSSAPALPALTKCLGATFPFRSAPMEQPAILVWICSRRCAPPLYCKKVCMGLNHYLPGKSFAWQRLPARAP